MGEAIFFLKNILRKSSSLPKKDSFEEILKALNIKHEMRLFL